MRSLRSNLILVAILSLFFILIIPAQAAYITTGQALGVPLITQVGDVDTFIAEGNHVGSPDSEETWVSNQLGTGVEWTISAVDVAYQETNLAGVFAFELHEEPDWFLVKNSTYIGLFENVASLDWGVFDVADFTADFNLGNDGDLWEISHVTEFDPYGGTTGGPVTNTVPEPGLPFLMGVGLMGLGYARRVNT